MADKAYQIAFGGEPVEDDFYADVSLLRVDENTGSPSTLEIQLATRLDDEGIWQYLDDDRLEPFGRVSAGVGFLGGGGLAAALGGAPPASSVETIFDGYITGVRFEAGSQPGAAFIHIEAMDASVLMSLEEKIVTWKDLSDSDIVRQIVSDHGLQPRIDATATVHQEADTTVVQRGTDLQFVRTLARVNGMEFYVEADTSGGPPLAYFAAPRLDGQPQPDLAIQFGEESNLRSFSARVVALRPLAVKAEQIDVRANQPNAAHAGRTQRTKLGARDDNSLVGGPLASLVTPRDAQAQMLVLGPPTADATELQTIVQGVRDEAAWFIEARGEINGDAYGHVLRPHRLVLVKGGGSAHSGKYYVTRVTHELQGSGAYLQSFEARRNARDLDGSEQFGEAGLAAALPLA